MNASRVTAVCASVLFLARCAGGCGKSNEAAPKADSGLDAAAPDASLYDGGSGDAAGGDASDAGADGPPCVPPPKPSVVPEGWEPYTDFSCEQPFYVPSSEQYLPEPLQWEPCPLSSGVASGCKWMKLAAPGSGPLFNKISPNQNGGHHVLLSPNVRMPDGSGHAFAVIADLDGTVQTAILDPRTPQAGTLLRIQDLTEGYYAIGVAGGDGSQTNAFKSQRKGVLIGTVGVLRPTLFQLEVTPSVYSWRISSKLLARGEAPAQRITVFPLDSAPSFELASKSADPDGLAPDRPTLLGDTAVFGVGNLTQQGIMAYDPVQKTHALIRWYGDTKQGAYNVGTDGKDLVWTYGQDHPAGEGTYPTRSIWTSPFTTDPKQIQGKRLRSDPQSAFDVNFVVGCGYAAHALHKTDGLLVVRLSDGVSWIVPNYPDTLSWQDAIGMTCEEVFATVSVVPVPGTEVVYSIARVRLDSLGPGIAPD